jgi:predicted nucleic acid-binding protein
MSNEEEWLNNLEEVKKYIDLNNKRPSQHDENLQIKKLGSWISTQQQNYKKKKEILSNKEIYNEWEKFISDEKYKKYFMSNEEEWLNNLKEVKKYINLNNKRPSQQDKNKQIKKLGTWISNQQKNYKNKTHIMSNEEIKKEYENFINDDKYKKYFISNEEEWLNNLEEVKKYINLNNKRPSQHDKNEQLKKLGNWISEQQQNYKKQSRIMSNEEIRKEWENFINDEKYKKYFM